MNKEPLSSIWNNKRMIKLRQQLMTNNYKGNTLCITCKEREGEPPSKLYPFNWFVIKTILRSGHSKLREMLKI